ncbi:serine/arginine-rich SC35-like splicing factor SCL28 isoform X2 [Camellia sinensis]|uniref:serine/arginine-rich SC35-like splicing factor SCL28 isoform X2 n=1 Tax=Camellia sinensis TaxID=4442 RepID=UPI001035C280|nr:serine/arginine-rich SC35-like splicing factor SCL28 isoform X2 [Camellia sinensis]
MGRYRSRSRSYSPRRGKRYDDPRESRSRRDRRSPAPSGLLVRNISLDARPEDLRIPFERFGPIKDVYLPKNYYTGEPRGFGFVKFRYPEDAADAKDHLNHTVIGGREIRIVFAEENRKTPQEMRRVTRPSGRGSYRRRSPARSPRRRYRSYSRSPSPERSGIRFLVKKRDLKNSELIKSETKIIKSRLLAYLLIKASSEVSFLNSPLSIINYNLHRPFLFYAFGL